MSSELALHAYVFVGNVFVNLLHGDAKDSAELGERDAIEALHRRVEPLGPGEIVKGIAELSAGDRELLARCCAWYLKMPDEELQTKLGVTQAEAESVVKELLHA